MKLLTAIFLALMAQTVQAGTNYDLPPPSGGGSPTFDPISIPDLGLHTLFINGMDRNPLRGLATIDEYVESGHVFRPDLGVFVPGVGARIDTVEQELPPVDHWRVQVNNTGSYDWIDFHIFLRGRGPPRGVLIGCGVFHIDDQLVIAPGATATGAFSNANFHLNSPGPDVGCTELHIFDPTDPVEKGTSFTFDLDIIGEGRHHGEYVLLLLPTIVSEPPTIVLLMASILGLGVVVWRRHQSASARPRRLRGGAA